MPERDENKHLREVLSKWPLRVYYDAPMPRSLNALTGSGGLNMQFEGSRCWSAWSYFA